MVRKRRGVEWRGRVEGEEERGGEKRGGKCKRREGLKTSPIPPLSWPAAR